MKYIKKFNENIDGIKFNVDLLSPIPTNKNARDLCKDILIELSDEGYSINFTSNKCGGFNIEIYGKNKNSNPIVNKETSLRDRMKIKSMNLISKYDISEIEHQIKELSSQFSDEFYLYHKYISKMTDDVYNSISFYYVPIKYKIN
jgi:hypothetical protein